MKVTKLANQEWILSSFFLINECSTFSLRFFVLRLLHFRYDTLTLAHLVPVKRMELVSRLTELKTLTDGDSHEFYHFIHLFQTDIRLDASTPSLSPWSGYSETDYL